MTSMTAKIFLCYVLFVGFASSQTVVINKRLFPIDSNNWKSSEFPPLSAADIGLSFDNGFLNVNPLDICVILKDEGNAPIEACPEQHNQIFYNFKVDGDDAGGMELRTSLSFKFYSDCTYLHPCNLLKILKNKINSIDDLQKVKFVVSYNMKVCIEESTEDVKPSFEFSLSGSTVVLTKEPEAEFNVSLIGSIAFIRHDSTCDLRSSILTIRPTTSLWRFEKINQWNLRYSKGSDYLPKCDNEIRSTQAKSSTLDYYQVDDYGLPTAVEYKVESYKCYATKAPPTSTSSLSYRTLPESFWSPSSTSLKRSPLIVIYCYCFVGISFVLALFL